MDNKKDDRYYFSKINDDIDAIKSYLNNVSLEQFLSDGRLIDAVMYRLIQIAENIKFISFAFKEQHPEMGWDEIIGFRNRIVHDYDRIDYSIVYSVATKDLDLLKLLISQSL